MNFRDKTDRMGNRSTAGERSFPKVWVTYKKHHESYEEDFRDLLEHGVDGVDLSHVSSREWGDLLQAAEGTDLKFAFEIADITEHGRLVRKHGLEPVAARMIGGAYQGKAIDRHLFAFAPGRHVLTIEEPIYDNVNCYKTVGRYYPDMGPPVKAEVVIPRRDYDGRQHLTILEGRLGASEEEHGYTLEFELDGSEGDLSRVGLAVYWEYGGTDQYWIFGKGNVSAWAHSTGEALKREIQEQAALWSRAAGGEFPHDRVVAMRFGDECFHVTGHLNNTAEISYPLWDYSQPSLLEFAKLRPGDEYPRTWGFPEIYGAEAYGDWMYVLHKGCARLCDLARQTLRELGTDVKLFRNITRYDIFAIGNDRDGSGSGLLAEALDVVHLDPYPCSGNNRYNDRVIPSDMGYACAIARPLGKPVMPWLQAHSYWAELGGLDHPSAESIERMVRQHMAFEPEALMWLGYPGTFGQDAAAWEAAGRMHREFTGHGPLQEGAGKLSQVLFIRHYSVWALSGQRDRHGMDRFLTGEVIPFLQEEMGLRYDAVELHRPEGLLPQHVNGGRLAVTCLPPNGGEMLRTLSGGTGGALVFCDRADWLLQAGEAAGVAEAVEESGGILELRLAPGARELKLKEARHVQPAGFSAGKPVDTAEDSIGDMRIEGAVNKTAYALSDRSADISAENGSQAEPLRVWRYKGILFVAVDASRALPAAVMNQLVRMATEVASA